MIERVLALAEGVQAVLFLIVVTPSRPESQAARIVGNNCLRLPLGQPVEVGAGPDHFSLLRTSGC